jgi:hypothetical protein
MIEMQHYRCASLMEITMPPSGFSLPAVAGLRIFFAVTLADLKQEVATGKHTSLRSGLQFEVSQISRVLESEVLQVYEQEILLTTKVFYTAVLDLGEEVALSQVESISTLHINEDGRVVRR